MAIDSLSELFRRLLAAKTSPDVKRILDELGDYPDVGPNNQFGNLGLYWQPYGGHTSNYSTIGLGTKAGRSLTERITNAIDAILEERAMNAVSRPTSPQRAASEWFGRPITGPDSGLYKWEYSDGHYDRKVAVLLLASENEKAPTIDVLDYGIGLGADQLSHTILSLQSGNKLNKRYLLGAFGQGGSSTLGFSEYALIISRSKSNPNQISFTLIRVLTLGEDYKEDCYAYLALNSGEDSAHVIVPNISVPDGPLTIYYNLPPKVKLPGLTNGTLVRHYTYKLEGLSGALSPQPGNLYHFLHFSMFDSLLPFRVIDLRDSGKEKDEVVKGTRNRLMTYAARDPVEEGDEGRTQLRHYRPMEYVAPQGNEPCIGIEYWAVFNQEKRKGGEYSLRKESNALYVQKKFPVVGTLNGQAQGEMSAQLLRDIGLGLVARHVVIHIDATNATHTIRRDLFATTREGFKEGPVLSSIMQVLEKMLREDEKLYALEKELTEKLISRENETTNEEVRQQITRLLLEAGFLARAEGKAVSEGKGEKQRTPDNKRRPYREPDPLLTLPFPQVTKFKIVTPLPRMEIQLNDSEVVVVETDADAEFDRRTLVAIRSEPNQLEIASKSPLRGGRARWRLRPSASATAGNKGKITVTITQLDGSQLSDSIDYEIFPAREKETKQNKGLVPPFDVRPISPDDPEWGTVWPDIEETSDKVTTVAYKPLTMSGGMIIVYYSTEFAPFKAQVEKLKLQSESMLGLFETNYKVWIGYHAILQSKANSHAPSGMDEDIYEEQQELERSRVAQVEVKQSLKTAELQHRLTREQGNIAAE